ncbi:MAG: glycosyltransferase [Bacteroidales bacterium]|nr:glycosyltransferase [Bacteroidales bacterium]
MTLQLLICTFNDGIHRVPELILAPIEGVSYLISWQQAEGFTPCELPAAIADRPDVEVTTLPGRGLSRNRNNCLLHASADVCLICDDDCRYTPEGLRAIVDTFKQHPEAHIITFVAKNSTAYKHYPLTRFNLSKKVRKFFVSSIEIALRREAVVGKVEFNEYFGLGAELFGAGEEAIFVADALNAGLNCQYFPIQVVEHFGPTTGVSHLADEKVLRANGAILFRNYRATMWLRLPLMAWRVKRTAHVPFAYACKHIGEGIKAMRRLSAEGAN